MLEWKCSTPRAEEAYSSFGAQGELRFVAQDDAGVLVTAVLMVFCWVLHALMTTRWLSCISSHLQYNANLEARMKYAEQPDKFMESEADLDEAVKAMLVVASARDLYP